jgi:hypothetical protein
LHVEQDALEDLIEEFGMYTKTVDIAFDQEELSDSDGEQDQQTHDEQENAQAHDDEEDEQAHDDVDEVQCPYMYHTTCMEESKRVLGIGHTSRCQWFET